MKLNELANNPGSTKNRKRIGRGPGSGTGKTSGHGHKGQKARKGVAIDAFEGGQNSIIRRLPKRGFTNIFKTKVEIVNTGRLQQFVDAGKLDASKSVTREVLTKLGLIDDKGLVKILASGELKTALNIEADRASEAAIKAIEAAKGSVKILSATNN
jgi:large subunit ribosomal protein L15